MSLQHVIPKKSIGSTLRDVRCESAIDFPGFHEVLDLHHVYSTSVKRHPLQFQARTLLISRRATQLYLAACPKDTMPWQCVDGIYAQKPGDRTMIARVAGGCSDGPVCTHFSGRNRKDHVTKR